MIVKSKAILPEAIEKRCARYGLNVAYELGNIVILDSLDRNKIIYYGMDVSEVVHLLTDLEEGIKGSNDEK